MDSITNRVLEIIETELETKLELSQDLFDNGLDSLGVLRLLAMLEDLETTLSQRITSNTNMLGIFVKSFSQRVSAEYYLRLAVY